MSDMDADQRHDAMLLHQMKTPPLSRDELRAELRRAREAKKEDQARAGKSGGK